MPSLSHAFVLSASFHRAPSLRSALASSSRPARVPPPRRAAPTRCCTAPARDGGAKASAASLYRVRQGVQEDAKEFAFICVDSFLNPEDFPFFREAFLKFAAFEIFMGLYLRFKDAAKNNINHSVIVSETTASGAIIGVAELTEVKKPNLFKPLSRFTASATTLVRGGDAAYLQNLAVLSAARRVGIGAEIVRACEDEARRWEHDEMWLHIQVGNDGAARFYDRLGYEVVQKDPKWVKFLGLEQLELRSKRLSGTAEEAAAQ